MTRRTVRQRVAIAALALASVGLVAAAGGTLTGVGDAATAGNYSTYFGGSGTEMTLGSTVDAQGNLYLTGETSSQDFPVTANAAQRVFGGGQKDAFVAKFDPTGKLVYATYLGGSGDDGGRGVAVDSSGAVYVTGATASSNFPTKNASDATLGGAGDAFLVKLDPTGSLLYSTLLGGSGVDNALALVTDGSGSAYLAGETNSADFPTTAGAADTTTNGDYDAFVTKVSTAGAIAYSTVLGGPQFDDALALTVDSSGDAFVTGKTAGGFPTSAGAFDTTPNGGFDMFVTKLNPSGSSVLYSTYLGGNSWDEGLGIGVDPGGNAYVTGNVQSPNFPTTQNAYQSRFTGTCDAAVTKLNPSGTALVYSTLLGATSWTEGDALAVDAAGEAFISGHLGSPDYPTTSGSFQQGPGGNVDGFLAKFDTTGSRLVYSTYVGGNDWDGAMTMALDSSANAYLSGATSSRNFPTTAGTSQAALSGPSDGFATKVVTSAGTPPPPPPSSDFQIAATPAAQDIARGNQASYRIDVSLQGGWVYHVSLSVSGLPAGATATFSPAATTSSSTMTVTTASTGALGTYQLTITGTSNGRQHTATVTLRLH